MAFTPYSAGELTNLVDVTKRLDPDGSIPKIAELLAQYNPILDDVPMIEGNLPVGHRTTVRNGLPSATWRKLNYGVRPSKSETTQVDDTIGMLEAYSEIDKDLAMLNGNTAEYRMSEDTPHLESMSNTMANTLLYGDTSANPERFLGLSPRYDVIGDPENKPDAQSQSSYLKNIIDAGGDTAAKQTSVWYVNWGPNTVHGIFPKGSVGGLQNQDLGEVTLSDNDGGRFQGFRTHYQWKMGLVVRDWRHIVRIANIELANMAVAADLTALYQAMIQARYTVPNGTNTSGVYYASPAVLAMLDFAAVEKGNAALTYKEVFGKDVLMFRGTPVKPCHAILETEAVLT